MMDGLKQHYDKEAKEKSLSAKSTMEDIFTRNLEVIKIEETIRNLLENKEHKTILEVGCGNGYTISKLARKYDCKFIGIDSNESMIKIALKRKVKNANFIVSDILKPKFDDEAFDIVFSERCLINLHSWDLQCKALMQIYKVLRKGGHYLMLETFDDGLNELNQARKSVGLKKISPAWHNYYFKKRRFESYVKGKFVGRNKRKITYDNFLSSYYFGSRVLYPSLIEGKMPIKYNTEFAKYFSLIPSVGNYSQLQLCVLQKI